MSDMHRYELGSHVLNAIDLSPSQPNYFVKYGDDAIEAQRRFLERLKIGALFDRRVMIAPCFGTSVVVVSDLSLSGYANETTSRCNGYDGVIVTEPDIPLLSGWGDCPWLLVANDHKLGTVHATRATIDDHILDRFFDRFLSGASISNLRIGVSPYIPPLLFGHEHLMLKRRQEWKDSGAITERDGRFHIDLYQMIRAELRRLGISHDHLFNAGLSSYDISLQSHELGGYAVSHRHATRTAGAREGRGAFCLMRMEKCIDGELPSIS